MGPKLKRHEDATQQTKRADQSLLFLTVAGTLCQMGNQDWYSWCVATLVMLATGAQAQDTSRLWDSSGLTAEKVVVAQEVPSFETSDYNEPEGTLIQGPPRGCMTGRRRKQPTTPGRGVKRPHNDSSGRNGVYYS